MFAGALRDPNESGTLSVTLSVWSDQIVMHNDDIELGEWPRDRVRIIPLDSTSYEFVAEGDRLLFTPDDRAAFASVATPSTSTAAPAQPKRRKPKTTSTTAKKSKPAETLSPGTTKPVKVRKPKRAKAAPKASAPAKSKKPRKPKLTRKKATTSAGASTVATEPPAGAKRRSRFRRPPRPAADTPTSQDGVSSVRPPGAVVAAVATTTAGVEASTKERRSLKVRSLNVASVTPGRGKASTSGKTSTRSRAKPKRWIGLIDTVRVYSVFGLDRVPVDVSLRGSEHQHTWDHRAAASSGPSKHICTICGKLKL